MTWWLQIKSAGSNKEWKAAIKGNIETLLDNGAHPTSTNRADPPLVNGQAAYRDYEDIIG